MIQSSGGVFEVEDRGVLIFSKKKTHRFPADGEISTVVNNLNAGKSLEEAQSAAAADVVPPPSFMEWLTKYLDKK